MWPDKHDLDTADPDRAIIDAQVPHTLSHAGTRRAAKNVYRKKSITDVTVAWGAVNIDCFTMSFPRAQIFLTYRYQLITRVMTS